MKPIQIENPVSFVETEGREAEEIIIGIDLGTTNSLAVIQREEEKSEILVDITPSIVTFFPNGRITPCVLPMENEKEAIVISSVKRKIGVQGEKISVFGKTYTPEEISAMILLFIKERAEEKLGKKIQKAIITVPAYFDDTQRSSTMMAARMAGIEVFRLLNEPTSAAIFFNIEEKEEGYYSVFDLGGGTFDVSILQMKMGVIRVLSVGGDTFLGGDDFDILLSKKLDCSREEGRFIKEELCKTGFHAKITLDEFDELVLPLVHKCVRIFKSALADAEIKKEDLKGMILVGGSTKMPIIKEAIKHEFNTQIFEGVDPDRIVALGAARLAFNIVNRKGNLLLDAIPLTLGIETLSGMVLKIIPRNSPIPIEKTEELTTSEDNQSGIIIHVVQGEREFVKDCRSLAIFEINDIPPMPKGVPQIIVSFKVGEDGILSVSAIEKISQIGSEIQIRPTYKLEYKDIREMFENAMKYGSADIKKRLIEETKIEATFVLEKTKNHALVNKTHIFDKLIADLQLAIDNNSEGDIKNIIDRIREKI
jgi:molecular chaperone HscA